MICNRVRAEHCPLCGGKWQIPPRLQATITDRTSVQVAWLLGIHVILPIDSGYRGQ